MPLKNRREDYSWPKSRIGSTSLVTDRKSYSPSETAIIRVAFRIVGGIREAFHPDVWTVAWEDFDKILRLTMKISVDQGRTLGKRKVIDAKKEVRKASFYWSRDPDLPYRIWAMIVPEDGGPPKIPRNVEDAKSMMLDVEKEFRLPAASLGVGSHRLIANVAARWGRRSFIEKGEVKSRSNPVVIRVG